MVTSVTDNGGTVGYTYYGHGGVHTVTGAGAGTSMKYDPNGFQEKLTDPDAGEINYTYNALGELLTQENPGTTTGTTVTTNMQYDLAGRCTTKTVAGVTYTYEYDTQLKGALSSVTSTNNMGIHYKYNQWGDMLQKIETIEGHDYVTKYEYDDKHHVTKKTYPSSFAVNYNYNNLGFLNSIKNGSTNIWETTGMNNMMQVTNYNSGNIATTNTYDHGLMTATQSGNNTQDFAFTWDIPKSNLLTRTGNIPGSLETFDYDIAQRCTSAVLKINNVVNISLGMSYFGNGNIQSKTDVGDFEYGINAGPHALSKINNLTSYNPLFPQNITYNEFKKVSTIEEDIYRMELTYGTAAERRKVILKNTVTNDVLYTKYYADNYERIEFTNQKVRELNYISSPSGLCAIFVKNSNPDSDTLYYIFKDHLGSITTITNNKDNKIQRLSYDLWGKRSIVNSDYTSYLFDCGFTGHEHLDAFNLINMNGRVYDPVVGRFLSPDNYVQGVGSQGYNRYTYCLNNPLKYSDPSGDNPLLIAAGLYFLFGTDMGFEMQKYVSPVGFHVDLHLGSESKGVGYDYWLGVPKGFGCSYGITGGQTYYWDYHSTGYSGWETRRGEEFSALWIYSYSTTEFSMQGTDEFDQATTRLTFGVPGLNAQYENDVIDYNSFKFFMKMTPSGMKKSDGGDRWRTSAVRFELGLFNFGLNIMTGDPGPDGYRSTIPGTGEQEGKDVYSGGTANKYREGTFYFGITGIGRFGRNNERIRHKWQDKFAHDPRGIPNFSIDKTRRNEWYWYFGGGSGSTLW